MVFFLLIGVGHFRDQSCHLLHDFPSSFLRFFFSFPCVCVFHAWTVPSPDRSNPNHHHLFLLHFLFLFCFFHFSSFLSVPFLLPPAASSATTIFQHRCHSSSTSTASTNRRQKQNNGQQQKAAAAVTAEAAGCESSPELFRSLKATILGLVELVSD